MAKLTQKQFEALIEYIDAVAEKVKPTSDLYESIRLHEAKEVLAKELLARDTEETPIN